MRNSTNRKQKNGSRRNLLFAALFFLVKIGISQTVLVPYTGSTSVPCGSNVLLQDHAGNSNYSASADGFVVLDAGALASINISGTYSVESGYDYVRIYDGIGIGGTLLGTYTGLNMSMSFQGAPGQTLTLRFSSDASVNYGGFNLNVEYTGACFSAPCSGAPGSNSVTGPTVLICPNYGPNTLSLTNNYITGGAAATATALTGLTYSWATGTTSAVGPFGSAIASASSAIYVAPGTSVTTYYQAVITCTNGGALTTSATAGVVMIAGTTTNVVPYFEDFEGIGYANKLPNCSWSTPALGTTFQTYISSNTNNRVPLSGTSFGAFAAPSNSVFVYTNGIQMEPGITYSAAAHYATDYVGSNNWSSLSMFIASSQAAASATQIATTAPAISGPYKLLSNTFTVPTSGLYYLALNANGVGGSAPYLMIDDISVTIPCDNINGNSPTLTATSSNTVYCQNEFITVGANTADTYSWSTGDTGAIITPTALAVGLNNLFVTGTNTLTNCSSTAAIVLNIIPAPALNVSASSPTVCIGQAVNLSAYGQGAFNWNTGSNSSFISVSPNANTTYSVTLIGANGCSSTASLEILAVALPTISIQSLSASEICAGEEITLNATGANSYQWNWNFNTTNNVVLVDNPMAPTVYSLTGTNLAGCSNKTTFNQSVNACTGLATQQLSNAFKIMPNPNSGQFVVADLNKGVTALKVLDLSGRIVKEMDVTSSTMSIDISELANGLYYLQTTNKDGSSSLNKIVKH